MSMDLLKEELNRGTVRNVYLFYGPEEFLKKFYLNKMEELLLKEDFKELNRIVLEGKVDPKKLIEASETMPVFSEKKILIVRNASLFKSKKKGDEDEGKGKGKPQNDELLTYLQQVPEYTCIVFYESEIDKRMKMVEAIKKTGLIVEFPYQKPVELEKWVTKVFKSNKKEIDPQTAAQLVENSEQGMTEILNEINKLVLYLGDRPKVTHGDIRAVCTRSIKSRIFDLTDAISERNTVGALELLNDMVILKEPIPKILFMITRQFRQVLEMKLLNQKGITGNAAASRMGISPYVATKMQKQTRSFSTEQLQKALEESLELDLAIKTGKLNDRVAIELLIGKFVG